MTFQTNFDRTKAPLEQGGGKRIVDTAGYIPAEKQVQLLLNAGVLLDQQRSAIYDFDDPEKVPGDVEPLAVRSYGFDREDAEEAMRGIQERRKETIKEDPEIEEEPDPEVETTEEEKE